MNNILNWKMVAILLQLTSGNENTFKLSKIVLLMEIRIEFTVLIVIKKHYLQT